MPSYNITPDEREGRITGKRETLEQMLRNTRQAARPTGATSSVSAGLTQLGQGIASAISRNRRAGLQKRIALMTPQDDIVQALMRRGQK